MALLQRWPVLLLVLLATPALAGRYGEFAKVKVWTATWSIEIREKRDLKGNGLTQTEETVHLAKGRAVLRLQGDVTEDEAMWSAEDGRGRGSGRSERKSELAIGTKRRRTEYQGRSRCTATLQIDRVEGGADPYDFGGSCGEDEVSATWEEWDRSGTRAGASTERLMGASSEVKPLPATGLGLQGTRTVRKVERAPPGMTGGIERVEVHTWNLTPGEVEQIELVFEPVGGSFDRWLPMADLTLSESSGNVIPFKATVQKVGGGATSRRVAELEFTLSETSNEKGTCLNFPAKAAANTKKDLALVLGLPGNGPSPDSAQSLKVTGKQEGTISVRSFDFGAWGVLRVQARMFDGEVLTGVFVPTGEEAATIPEDRNGNRIADSWEKAKEASGVPRLDDDDGPAGQATTGDGLSLYEEYRGFVVLDDGGKRRHQRTEPRKKTLLVIDTHSLWSSEDWETATGMESFRIPEDLAADTGEPVAGRANGTNPNRGFGQLASWDYAVRVIKSEDGGEGPYGAMNGTEGWEHAQIVSSTQPKHSKNVTLWPKRIHQLVLDAVQELREALAPNTQVTPGGRRDATRKLLDTPDRRRRASEALARLETPEGQAALELALKRLIAVHECGHACGVDHHGVVLEGGKLTFVGSDGDGPQSCPTRYNIQYGHDRSVVAIIEMLAPTGMAGGVGRFCEVRPGCWKALNVNDR